MYERAKFNSRNQQPNESVGEYALALNGLAGNCNFPENQLDAALRDRFILGLRDENIRSKILKVDKARFDEVQAIAKAHELSLETKNIKTMASEINKVHYNQVKSSRSGPHSSYRTKSSRDNRSGCTRCLRPKHRGGNQNCPARNWKCKSCGEKGHIAARCTKRSSNKKSSRSSKFSRQSKDYYKRNLHAVKDEDDDASMELLRLSKFNDTKTTPPEIIKICINGIQLDAEIDTGACVGVLSSHDYSKCFSNAPLQSVGDKLFTVANGDECQALGKIEIALNNQFKTQAVVIESVKKFMPLVGRTWLDLISPQWRQVFQVNDSQSIRQVEFQEIIAYIKKDFSTVFEPSPHPIEDFQVKFTLNEGATPRFLKAAPVAFSLRDKVTEKLEAMVSQGKIAKVKHSEWASQVLIIPKKDGDIRICCNYKPTLNPALQDEIYPLPVIDDIS